MPWHTVSSRVAYENPWIVLREDEVLRPDGAPGLYGVVETRNPAVFVVALADGGAGGSAGGGANDDGADPRVLLVTVDRYTTGLSIEVPAGGSDVQEPLVAAKRVLAEETGCEADEWTRIGRVWALNGIARSQEHVFLARGVRPLPRTGKNDTGSSALSQDAPSPDAPSPTDLQSPDPGEGITNVTWVPFTEAMAMIADGRITDGETVMSLSLAAIHLGRLH
jgi:8-oxo-dGTP pyrophosphatase MutT (NUDIX family)